MISKWTWTGIPFEDRAQLARELYEQKIAGFYAKYGETLTRYGQIYGESHKLGTSGGLAEFFTEEIRLEFARALCNWLFTLPEETRAQQLAEFLTELDHFNQIVF